MKPLTHFVLAVALVVGCSPALAAAYKCTNPGGSITFSDTPCPNTASKGEKVLGRGAGSNPLTKEEKATFKAAMLSRCKAPRNVCECVSDYLAESLTYEEVIQESRSRNIVSADVQDKTDRAVALCRTPATN